MKKHLKIFLLFMIFVISIPSYALKLYPLGFDKNIDEGGFQEFTITNTSKEILRYKLYAKETGKKTDISDLVTVYPTVLTVEPFSEGKFKVYVEETDLPKGEYSFMLGIRPVKMPKLKETQDGKINSTIAMKTALELEMFTYSKETLDKFDILEEKFYEKNGKKWFTARIKNNIGRGVELATGFTDNNNNLITLHNEGRLFNGSTARINVEIPRGAKYIVFWDHNNTEVICQQIKIK